MELGQEEINNLLLDPSFRNWALKLNTQDFERWENILEDDIKLNQLARDARQIVIQIELTDAKQGPEDKASFQRLLLKQKNGGIADSTVNRNTGRAKHRRIGFNQLARIAAVLSFLIVFSGILYFATERNNEQSMQKVVEIIRKQTQNGQQLFITLPDGSKVKLNSNSSISYPKEFFDNRKVELMGEAFFDVVRDVNSPFVVNTNNFQTEVLGTSFNINAYEVNNAKVSVTTGTVKVRTTITDEDVSFKILEKEQAVMISQNELKESEFDKDEILWKDGILVFTDENIHTISSKIQRWYNVTVTVANETDIKGGFSGKYSNESLEEILTGMSYALNFSFRMEGSEIIINGKN